MNGWSFWIAQGGTFRSFDVFISDFAQAEATVLAHVGGIGKAESYTRRPAERMMKICKLGAVREFHTATPAAYRKRGQIVRGSRMDTASARS